MVTNDIPRAVVREIDGEVVLDGPVAMVTIAHGRACQCRVLRGVAVV